MRSHSCSLRLKSSGRIFCSSSTFWSDLPATALRISHSASFFLNAGGSLSGEPAADTATGRGQGGGGGGCCGAGAASAASVGEVTTTAVLAAAAEALELVVAELDAIPHLMRSHASTFLRNSGEMLCSKLLELVSDEISNGLSGSAAAGEPSTAADFDAGTGTFSLPLVVVAGSFPVAIYI